MLHFPCHRCRKPTMIDLLDAKPRMTPWLWLIERFRGQAEMLRYASDHGYDFTVLECQACYGPE